MSLGKLLLIFFTLQSVSLSSDTHEFKSCVGSNPPNFQFLRKELGIEHFIANKKDLSMAIKCFGKGVHASDLQKKFGREILITHLKGNIYYFDFNRESVLSRTYLVESPDSLNQITFTTDITLKNSVDKLHDFISNWLNNAR